MIATQTENVGSATTATYGYGPCCLVTYIRRRVKGEVPVDYLVPGVVPAEMVDDFHPSRWPLPVREIVNPVYN